MFDMIKNIKYYKPMAYELARDFLFGFSMLAACTYVAYILADWIG